MRVWAEGGTPRTLKYRENKTARGSFNTPDGSGTLAINVMGKTSYGGYMSGDMAELIIYTRQLSDAELDQLYDEYLKPKYGLP